MYFNLWKYTSFLGTGCQDSLALPTVLTAGPLPVHCKSLFRDWLSRQEVYLALQVFFSIFNFVCLAQNCFQDLSQKFNVTLFSNIFISFWIKKCLCGFSWNQSGFVIVCNYEPILMKYLLLRYSLFSIEYEAKVLLSHFLSSIEYVTNTECS